MEPSTTPSKSSVTSVTSTSSPGEDYGVDVKSKKRKSKTSQTGTTKKQKQVDKFVEQIQEYLKKQQLHVVPTANEVIDEKLKEKLDKIPDIEGCKDMTCLKRLLVTMSIEYSTQTCPIFEGLVGTDCLMTYAQDPSIQNLESVISHYDLNKDQYKTILRCLIPPNLKIFGTTATEPQYTTTHFSPLFELSLLSKNDLSVNSNTQIPPHLLNWKILSEPVRNSLQEFQVDGILAQQYYNCTTITKIIREDCCSEHSVVHFNHPDFLRVVFVMRLAISMNVRLLVKGELNKNIHDKLFILGMTTDCKQTNLYCMHATIKQDFSISYTLYTVGNFRHDNLNERVQLVDIILKSFSIPNPSELETYLKQSKPSKKEPTIEKKKTTLIINNLIIKLHDQVSERLCTTTKSLWRGELTISNSNKSWNVYVKQEEADSNDWFICYIPFLTLFIARAISGEIILLEGEKVGTISQEDEIIRLICDLLTQLCFLKKRLYIHNDLKPQNIVKYDHHYFIIDYGLSIRYSSIDGNVCKDADEEVITSTSGSAAYDSPEKQERGAVSPQSDLFSLGCSINEIIQGNTVSNEFNTLMKDLIPNMIRPNIDERWTVERCRRHMKTTKYANELQTSWNFFKDKERYRSQFQEEFEFNWDNL